MIVQWNYDGSLTYRHTAAEVDDPEWHCPQKVTVSEFIIHAANLHLFKSGADKPGGVGLWSPERTDSLPTPRVRTR